MRNWPWAALAAAIDSSQSVTAIEARVSAQTQCMARLAAKGRRGGLYNEGTGSGSRAAVRRPGSHHVSAGVNIPQGNGNVKWDLHSHRHILSCVRQVQAGRKQRGMAVDACSWDPQGNGRCATILTSVHANGDPVNCLMKQFRLKVAVDLRDPG